MDIVPNASVFAPPPNISSVPTLIKEPFVPPPHLSSLYDFISITGHVTPLQNSLDENTRKFMEESSVRVNRFMDEQKKYIKNYNLTYDMLSSCFINHVLTCQKKSTPFTPLELKVKGDYPSCSVKRNVSGWEQSNHAEMCAINTFTKEINDKGYRIASKNISQVDIDCEGAWGGETYIIVVTV